MNPSFISIYTYRDPPGISPLDFLELFPALEYRRPQNHPVNSRLQVLPGIFQGPDPAPHLDRNINPLPDLKHPVPVYRPALAGTVKINQVQVLGSFPFPPPGQGQGVVGINLFLFKITLEKADYPSFLNVHCRKYQHN